jgi:predicted DNA binding CopG/RHH family protein
MGTRRGMTARELDAGLDAEERAERRALERADARGELRPVKHQKKVKAEMQAAARRWMATERKEARMNIRLRPSTLAALKAKAAEEGLPYQVLAASLIHRYVFPVPAPMAVAASPKKRRSA